MAAMAANQHDVKVKFIETQFISSDAASFKSVVQRLTGKHSTPPEPASSSHAHTSQRQPQPQRPRPCRPALFAANAGSSSGQNGAGGWAHQQQSGNDGGHHHGLPAPSKQAEPAPALRVEDLYELCDFSDLLYATAGTRRDGGFPY